MADVKDMALRDWFAGVALAGLLAKPDIHPPVAATTLAASSATLQQTDDQLAQRAYRLADALLKAGGHPQT